MKYKVVKEYSGLKVGDRFVITSEPRLWDSSLNDNSPFGRVIYPYYGTIKKIAIDNTGYLSVSMTDGKYGWSLDSLLINNRIQSLRVVRREKLKKLNAF